MENHPIELAAVPENNKARSILIVVLGITTLAYFFFLGFSLERIRYSGMYSSLARLLIPASFLFLFYKKYVIGWLLLTISAAAALALFLVFDYKMFIEHSERVSSHPMLDIYFAFHHALMLFHLYHKKNKNCIKSEPWFSCCINIRLAHRIFADRFIERLTRSYLNIPGEQHKLQYSADGR